MNDDLERRIQSLPWRKPSAGLKDKIFQSDGDHAVEPTPRSASRNSPHWGGGQRVTLKLAIALATAAAFLGFIAGTQLPTNQPDETMVASTVGLVQTDIRIVETSSPRNSFDFSSSPTQILPGDFVASIDAPEEIAQ